jgi:sulfoxide reductase heme-binding subunit YedZ
VTPHPLIAATSVIGPSTYWYATRATGIVALLLLTLTVVLGVVDVARVSSPRFPRFLIDGVHRTVSLLAVAFLVVHIVTAALDSFAPINLIAGVVPFTSPYRPLWLGLGAIAFDLMCAVAITSALRARLGHRTWRAVHWLGYLTWPLALLHGLGTGSDAREQWLLALTVICAASVLAAALYRTLTSTSVTPSIRTAGIAGALAFSLALAVWTANGPLANGWARRSGTPASLLTKPVQR